MKYYILALTNLISNPIFNWIGNEWEGLEWLDERPCPTREEWEREKTRLISIQPLENCKMQAKQLLSDSDWSELPSVIEGLENSNEWKSYRIEIRKYIINPVENPIFPNKPETLWKDI